MNETAYRKASIFYQWVQLLTALALPILGWTINELISHDRRLTSIEASRFTAEHGAQVWREIADIREAMAALPRETPPKWFVDRVDKLDSRLERVEAKVDALRSGG